LFGRLRSGEQFETRNYGCPECAPAEQAIDSGGFTLAGEKVNQNVGIR